LLTACACGPDLFFTVYVYLQVLANVLMAVNTLDCGTSTSGDDCNILFWNNLADDSFAAFACTQAASQFLAACMFARGIHIPQVRSWSMLWVLWCCPCCAVRGLTTLWWQVCPRPARDGRALGNSVLLPGRSTASGVGSSVSSHPSCCGVLRPLALHLARVSAPQLPG